jgi:hypothetical protein
LITLTVRPETARGVLDAAESAGLRQQVASWPCGIDRVRLVIDDDALPTLLGDLVGTIDALQAHLGYRIGPDGLPCTESGGRIAFE